jgi:hypothetical protein
MPKLTKEFIADLYRKQVSVYGKVLSESEFRRQTGVPPYHWWKGYWKSWSEFQIEAGFAPTPQITKIPDEVLLREYADLALRLNRLPTSRDLIQRKKEDPSFPGQSTFGRLARLNEFLLKLEAWCEGKPAFAAVAAMIERRRIDLLGRRRDADRVRGFVYLARRGPVGANGVRPPEDMIYEIGREIGAGKQLQRIAVRTSCSPGTIHVIDTDDPEGIERYWRSRFRSRRRGRRYFRLFPEDVPAFRWRRYQ